MTIGGPGGLFSNQVPGTPGGPAAVPEPFYVTNFGATGNGVTNDLPAYNAALIAAGPAGWVHFPGGGKTYFLNGIMNIPPGYIITGAGKGLNSGSQLLFPSQASAGVLFTKGAGQENADALLANIHIKSSKIALAVFPANNANVPQGTTTTLGPASFTQNGQTVGDRRWYAVATVGGNRGVGDPFHPIRGGGQGSVQGWVPGQTVVDGAVTWTINIHSGVQHLTRGRCSNVSVANFTCAGFMNQGAIGGPDLTQPTDGTIWDHCFAFQNGLGAALVGDKCGTLTEGFRAVGTHAAGPEEIGIWDFSFHGCAHISPTTDLLSGMSYFMNGEGWRGTLVAAANTPNTLAPYVVSPGLIVSGNIQTGVITGPCTVVGDGNNGIRNGNVIVPVTPIAQNYTDASAFDQTISCDTSVQAFTVTLPLAPPDGYTVFVLDATGNCAVRNVTVVAQNPDKMRGVAAGNVKITTNFGGIILIYSSTRGGWTAQFTT